jgi:FtsH-binding integral membrane protein
MSSGLIWVVIIAELALAFTAHKWSATLPMGYWLFSLFAFLSGLTLVPILAMAGAIGGATIIMRALVASVSVFAAAALYGHVTNRNLLGMRGFLMMSLFGVIAISILGIFIPWSNSFEIIISGGIVVLFAGFTMYDIQLIKSHPGLNPLLAAILLYINFINIFTAILRLLIAFNRR